MSETKQFTPGDHFTCPQCGYSGKNVMMINVQKSNVGICFDCRVKWDEGYGLLSSWQDEEEWQWELNDWFLSFVPEAEHKAEELVEEKE